MEMPKRHGSSDSYRYGFNGMEKDDETYGVSGTAYDFGARIYSSRLGRWLAPDPEAQFVASQYLAFANNPVLFVDPDGGWVPGITRDGKIYVLKEKGDDKNSLMKFFGGSDNAKKYLKTTDYDSDKVKPIINLNEENVYSEGTDWYYNEYQESDDQELAWKNGRCHSIALCGTRGQSVIDFEKNSIMNNLHAGNRDDIVDEQYTPISQNDDGSFNFEEEGKVGESVLTFHGHTAVYFGTNADGTEQYFLSKNNAGDYSIDTYEEVKNKYGTTGDVKAYDIKDEYKGKNLNDDNVEGSSK